MVNSHLRVTDDPSWASSSFSPSLKSTGRAGNGKPIESEFKLSDRHPEFSAEVQTWPNQGFEVEAITMEIWKTESSSKTRCVDMTGQSTRFEVEFKGFITGQNISAGPTFPGCNSLKPTTQQCVCKERQSCPQLSFQTKNKHLNNNWTQVNNSWTLHGGFRGTENGQSSTFTLHSQRGRAVLLPTHTGVFSCILQL